MVQRQRFAAFFIETYFVSAFFCLNWAEIISCLKNLVLYCLILTFASCAAPAETPKKSDTTSHEYQRAFELLNERKADSAFVAFSRAKEFFADREDGLWVGSCLVQMAIILTNQADYFGGQETSLEALSYLDTDNPDHSAYLSANFNNLGIATYSLDDYERALDFYDSAIAYSSDSLNTLTYINNKARVYHNMREYDKAISLYGQIEEQTKARPRDYARLLTNLTLSRLRQNPQYNAVPEFLAALQIREEHDDLSGQNSSYMHLSDYYEHRRTDSALFYARKFYKTSLAVKNADDQIKALQRLIRLNPDDSAKRYFETYKSLADSVQFARASAKNQFTLIRYEVEKNKADNLRLQKENVEKAYQVTKQRAWTATAIGLALLIVGGGTFWYRKREQRLALEAQNRIKAHQLKTSKKIHDVVANGLYRVMAEIENKKDIDREDVLDRLEDMYEQSRDISYEHEKIIPAEQSVHEAVSDLLKSFATESTKIIIVGNDPQVWVGISPLIRNEAKHILQELMVNMRKHSAATNVVIRFEWNEKQFHIFYSDNGIGLPETFDRGNGLTNAGTRIESLNGDITFVGEPGKGLKVTITIPVP